ncbi:MAG: HD domain-containing protein [Candidatus Peribacteria bacterium]|jgi:putative hydrolase of HD superfamily|nr:HD domain-containing protein [Candidatus Peribacteria bacterium]
MHNLQQTFFDFVTMTQQLAKVERSQHYQGTERFENDVEHSYQLTMLAWLIIDYLKLPLNKDLVIKLALAHDIIEVYAGDTLPFNNPNAIAEKEKKEADALSRLASEF